MGVLYFTIFLHTRLVYELILEAIRACLAPLQGLATVEKSSFWLLCPGKVRVSTLLRTRITTNSSRISLTGAPAAHPVFSYLLLSDIGLAAAIFSPKMPMTPDSKSPPTRR